jgi:hypothetical protein
MVIVCATNSVLVSRRPVLAWLLFALLLACSCSDPGTAPKEPLPEFPVMDSTTHDYSWTHVTVGPPVPTFVNYLYRVHAFSDTDVWMIGLLELDTSILSIPSGKPKNTANVVHWDGSRVSLLSYEAIVGESSRPSPTEFREILEVNGNIWLMTPHGYTEILPDTVRIVKFKEFRTLPYYSKMTKGRSGRVYWYNEEGDLAYLDPSNDEKLIHVETYSEDFVRNFNELDRDRYLLGRGANGEPLSLPPSFGQNVG